MKGSIYTLGYAGILGVVCSLLLTAVASVTAPMRTANAEAEETLNILTALQVPMPENASKKRLAEIREKNVREEERQEFIAYAYVGGAEGKVEAVAVRFAGWGLWGPMKGFLAVEADMRTIRGLTFYEQEETPGLGGKIDEPKFKKQFVGKKIVDETGRPGIIIKGGKAENAQNEVDAITGATMTCDKVREILTSVAAKIVKEYD